MNEPKFSNCLDCGKTILGVAWYCDDCWEGITRSEEYDKPDNNGYELEDDDEDYELESDDGDYDDVDDFEDDDY